MGIIVNPLKCVGKGMVNIFIFGSLHLSMKEWKNTIFQGFYKGDRIFNKRKLRYERLRQSVHFAMLTGNDFTKVVSGKVNIFFGIWIWETLLSNIEQQKTQFWGISIKGT